MSVRKAFHRVKKARLKRMLAQRDGLVPAGAFEKHPEPYVRCAECDALIPFVEITIGHVVAVSRGGTNARDNLRLECDSCNQEANNHDQFKGSLERMEPDGVTLGLRERLVQFSKAREESRTGHVYDSVRVLSADGRPAAYTSLKQIGFMVPAGKMRVVGWDENGLPNVVQLIDPYPLLNPDHTLRENRCAACDSFRYLRAFSFWPRWHPEWTGARKTHRTIALCRHCRVDVQRWIDGEVERVVPMGKQPMMAPDMRPKVALLLAVHGRLKRGLDLSPELAQDLRTRIGVDLEGLLSSRGLAETLFEVSLRAKAYQDVAEKERHDWHVERRKRILAAGVDYHEIFWKILWQRRGEYEGFLRTDGKRERTIEEHLKNVRIEREERARRGRESNAGPCGNAVPAQE